MSVKDNLPVYFVNAHFSPLDSDGFSEFSGYSNSLARLMDRATIALTKRYYVAGHRRIHVAAQYPNKDVIEDIAVVNLDTLDT